VAAVREFFGSSQLSQFMEQTNPLAELTHKRTLSALGPGGLRRERAGFDVRDVHHSHYGRICPIETPEGPNIGLIGRLASYARVNKYGFIETPYRRVYRVFRFVRQREEETRLSAGVCRILPEEYARLIGRTTRAPVVHPMTGEVLVGKARHHCRRIAAQLRQVAEGLENPEALEIRVKPFVTDEIVYLAADTEDQYVIAQGNAPLTEKNEFVRPRASVSASPALPAVACGRNRLHGRGPAPDRGHLAALIPFLEHDDANRALMGSNMQRQAVPLLQPEVPLVSTGMEDGGLLTRAGGAGREDGEVISVRADQIVMVREDDGRTSVCTNCASTTRSNQSTCIDQRPIVYKGQRVKKGDVIADSSSRINGRTGAGPQCAGAFLSWEGGNYEDAVLISERLVREDKFTSIHIEKHEVEARDTKLGPEEITYDIPNVGEDALKDLDEHGIVRIGAEVGPNDILVGKITPKGEKELTPGREAAARHLWREGARGERSSLRLPHGERGKVVDVKVFTREEHRDLPAGVDKMVRVSVAQKRKLTEGDKMAGRHGNKGVISRSCRLKTCPSWKTARRSRSS
jgi:DNA-directed RNA polymerase subunit beta